MHAEANQFIVSVKNQTPEFFKDKKVLEVGSLDINGSVRPLFDYCDYTGIDLGAGNGVDVVCAVHELIHPKQYDVVISSEMLEHDQYWEKSLRQMYENLKPGGLIVLTCAAPKRQEHGTIRTDGGWAAPFTSSYYRNISVEDFASVLPPVLFERSHLGYGNDGYDLYFAGIKKDAKTATVTVEISTLNRLFTTLPATITSIINQTRKPERLVLYDDGEQNELRDIAPYAELFHLLEEVGIDFETFTTPRKGLAYNHQHALETAKTDFIIRVDDDHVLEPNVIEELLKVMEDETIGAVAPLVHHPGNVQPLPPNVTGEISDIFNGTNLQWYQFNGSVREADHLYSCYAYRVSAARKAGGYPALSPISFREDSWFSMKIKRAGYSLRVTPFAKVWHLQQQTGGIRSFTDGSLWAKDDEAFREWLASIDIEDKSPKLITVDAGLGDHFALLSVLPILREKHKERGLILALCYPEVFKDEGLELISIAEARQRLGSNFEDSNLYRWCWQNAWNDSLSRAMLEFWSQP